VRSAREQWQNATETAVCNQPVAAYDSAEAVQIVQVLPEL